MDLTPYYEEPGITIYHGDCLEILPLLPKVDLLLTDPPYIVAIEGRGIAGKREYYKTIGTQNLHIGFHAQMLNDFENWVCFCGKQQLLEILGLAQRGNWMLVTWGKVNPTPLTNNVYLPDTEYIVHRWISGRLFGGYQDKSRFIITGNAACSISHPTVKPLEVVSKMVVLGTEEGDTILDPFMGSGTTLRAAKDLGRQAIGIEIEEKYCEIAVKRLGQEVLKF